MRRLLAGAVLLLAAVAALLAFTFRASFREPAEFRFANLSEPRTLDPALMTGNIEGRIADALFEGLTVRDPATLRPVPGVARSWQVSDDGRRYVFRLREDARWSDGSPVTAADFAYSWRRLLDPALGAEYAYLLHGVRLARAFHTGRATARALRGRVAAAFDALRARGSAAGAADWRAFLTEGDVVSALAGEDDAWLQGVLRGLRPPLGPDAARFAAALRRAASHLDAEAAEAERRLGVDAGFWAADAHTFVVELEAPTPYFLELTAFYPTFPVPRQVVERPGRADDWFLPDFIVGNGPFLLEAWRVGDRIRLRRSPTYWGRAGIRLASIDARPIENLTTALNLYFTDDLDWLPDYPSELADALRDHPDHYSGPGFMLYYYRFNTLRPPLSDPRVREALCLAVDRESITRDVLGLGQQPAYHVVPPGVPGYERPPSAIRHDPDAARALLAEAGYPGGAGFPEIGILYNTHEDHKKIAEVVADQLRRELGIRVQPYNQEWQSYQATVQAGDYDLARAGWIGDYLDPNTFLDLWVTAGGNNQTGWGDPAYDRLIRDAADPERFLADPRTEGLAEPERTAARVREVQSAVGPAARREALARLRMQLLREAEAILVQRGFPILPVYTYVVKGLVKPWVHGFHAKLLGPGGRELPNLQDLHPLRGIWVEGRP